jgi:predicted transcriptional regulator
MRAKPYSTVVVRVPAELRGVLDALAEARGEPLSLIVRDALRVAASDRRVDLGMHHLASGPNPKDFR